MISKIFSTSGTLGVVSVINFLIVLMISNSLGIGGVSEMGLIVLGISFVVMINNIIGGASLVYMVPRNSTIALFVNSYLWAVFSALIMTLVIWGLGLVSPKYILYVGVLGLLESFFSVNIQILLGSKKIGLHNALRLLQKISLIGVFYFLGITIQNYVYALLMSYLLVLIVSLIFVFNQIKEYKLVNLGSVFKQSFNYGIQIQSSNILQLLNYRLVYIFIEKSMGEILGVFIVAVQLAESLWIPSKALSIIQYSTVANEKEEMNKRAISFKFLKLSFFITLLGTIVLLLVPEGFIGWLFGKDFSGVSVILMALALGVISMSLNQIFSHYFSGKGIYHYNIIASAIGLIVIVIAGWFLIDEFKLIGAGIVTSLSYLCSTIFLGVVFFKEVNIKLGELMLTKKDVLFVLKKLKKKT
jgi:O-antigen/teichoic acid export membrane protein